MLSEANMGRLYLAAAFVLAGSSVIAARFISAYIPPLATTFFSLVFASLTAALVCGKKMYDTARRISKKTWLAILLQAFFGSFLFRVFLTMGLRYIGAAEAGIITGTTPAITALLTWLLLRERLNARTVAGVLLALVGLLLVQGFPFAWSANLLHPLGVFLVLGASASESLFTILSRKIHTDTGTAVTLPPLIHAGLVSIVAMALCLVPTLIERPWVAIAALPVSGWLALIWYGSIITVVAFALMFAGAKRCDGYTIAAFAGLIPVSSTLLSVVALKEPLIFYQVAGCAFVVFATTVISGKRKQGK